MKHQKLPAGHQHIVCFSGGHSSALVAVEVVRRYGAASTVLLNHDINSGNEHSDIKRFKRQVARALGVKITYANIGGLKASALPDQFDVVIKSGAFRARLGAEFCTTRLKTEPFHKYLAEFHADKNCTVYYGFDANETARIQRRTGVLAARGYRSDYPLALWPRTIQSITELGVKPPLTYAAFKHANCIGCLKAGRQHWYIVFCTRKDIWEKAKHTEDALDHTIIKGTSLEELEPLFLQMQRAGVPATEHIQQQTFWATVRQTIKTDVDAEADVKPCECVV